jgi:hypothetical protein
LKLWLCVHISVTLTDWLLGSKSAIIIP